MVEAGVLDELLADLNIAQLRGNQASSLSGGEGQRIRLATQIGSSLVGVLYILDEPSIGLHQRDNDRLIGTLERLRDLGNTVLVVEHDEQMMRSADWLVDMGPGAGEHGGHVVAEGTAYVQAGCGVVADSKPEREYEETLEKAGAMFKAIDLHGGDLSDWGI